MGDDFGRKSFEMSYALLFDSVNDEMAEHVAFASKHIRLLFMLSYWRDCFNLLSSRSISKVSSLSFATPDNSAGKFMFLNSDPSFGDSLNITNDKVV